ncbi:MAG: hypothetical protein WCH46_04405 [bacterium]
MNEERYNEQELKVLEDDIRAMGIPYSADEPDERYFANFRVQLMEKIESRESKKSALSLVWSWLTGSPIRSFSIATALGGVIIAALLIRPNAVPPVASVELPYVTTQAQVGIPVPEVKTPVAPHISAPIAASSRKESVTTKSSSEDLAMLDGDISGTDSVDPVDLESMSVSDLEAVVEVTQSMN